MVMDMFAGQAARQGDPCRRRSAHVPWPPEAGVTDPEAKRKIIGREFVEVFQAEANKAEGGLIRLPKRAKCS